MSLESLFLGGEDLRDLFPDNKDMAVLERVYGKEYFSELKGHIKSRVADYLYNGEIDAITSGEFREINNFLFNTAAGTLKRIIDNSIMNLGYQDYSSFFREINPENLPDPVFYVCLSNNDLEMLRNLLDPDELNIILGLEIKNKH